MISRKSGLHTCIALPLAFQSHDSSTQAPQLHQLQKKQLWKVRTQFQQDRYGCIGSLERKKLGRDPFHQSIPYTNGCPEIEGLFRYCATAPYRGSLPWAE
ncbi:hypothetical protein REPUB_Repub02eG0117100 [Reevesia pubescens]